MIPVVAGATARHSVSVAGVVVNGHGEVLVVRRRDNGRWEPPGGVLELDETIDDGLRREVREETGYEVEVLAQTGVYKNMARHVIALVFRCGLTGGRPLLSTNETTSLRWLAPADVTAYLGGTYAVRIRDALVSGQPPAIRAHDGRVLLPS